MPEYNVLMPSELEIEEWDVATIKHVSTMMYFIDVLRICDPWFHDIDPGEEYNKFSWEVTRGCALQYRMPPLTRAEEKAYIKPSIDIHRTVHHHVMWNSFNEKATEDDMRIGALDTLFSLLNVRGKPLENRPYRKTAGTLEEIEANPAGFINGSNSMGKIQWVMEIIREIRRIEFPPVERITSLSKIVNVGLPIETYNRMIARLGEHLRMLRDEQGYLLYG